jgi:hypothetical protein
MRFYKQPSCVEPGGDDSSGNDGDGGPLCKHIVYDDAVRVYNVCGSIGDGGFYNDDDGGGESFCVHIYHGDISCVYDVCGSHRDNIFFLYNGGELFQNVYHAGRGQTIHWRLQRQEQLRQL